MTGRLVTRTGKTKRIKQENKKQHRPCSLSGASTLMSAIKRAGLIVLLVDGGFVDGDQNNMPWTTPDPRDLRK